MAVFFSLLVARLLTPMMAAHLLKAPSRAARDPFWMPAYLATARWAFTHRAATLALVAIFTVVCAMPLASGAIKGTFMPLEDISQTLVSVELPPGSTLAQTRKTAQQTAHAVAPACAQRPCGHRRRYRR